MAENPVFDPNNILGDDVARLSRSRLVALAADLCAIAYKESGENGYRGGIRPENISIDPDNNVAVGPGGPYNKDDCSKEELEYIAPELFWSGKAGSRADVYSIGLILYIGINGKLPFVNDGSDTDCAEAFRKRMNGDKINTPAGVGKKLGAIITQATEFSASNRYENTLELASELKSLLVKLDAETVQKAAIEAFGKSEEELSDIERMMLGIITESALNDDLANVPTQEADLAEAAEECSEDDIEVEIEELPPEPDELEEESIEVEIEELPYEPEESEEETVEVEIEELPYELEKPVEETVKVEIEELPSESGDNSGLQPTIDERSPESDIESGHNDVTPIVVLPTDDNAEKNEGAKQEDDEPIEVPEFVNSPKRKPSPTPPAPAPKAPTKRPKAFIVILGLCVVLAIAAIIYNKQASKNEDGSTHSLPPINYVTPEPTETILPEETAVPEETPEPEPSEEPVEKVSTYQVFVEDISWDQAEQKCVELGGHLVTISNEEEFNKVCEQLNATNAKYAWVGCYRNSVGVLTWTSGENADYFIWAANEPSNKDGYDGTPEDYILLVRQSDGTWKYNDSRMNPVADYYYFYSGRIAYVCETIE